MTLALCLLLGLATGALSAALARLCALRPRVSDLLAVLLPTAVLVAYIAWARPSAIPAAPFCLLTLPLSGLTEWALRPRRA